MRVPSMLMVEEDSQHHIRGAWRHLAWIRHATLVGSGLEIFVARRSFALEDLPVATLNMSAGRRMQVEAIG
jgi:hypothetical protein